MDNTFLVVLPPLIALILAYMTRHIIFSLFIGIVTAAFIAKDFFIGKTTVAITQKLYAVTLSKDNLYMCIFLLILGILVTLIGYAGGIFSWRNLVSNHLKDRKSAETSSLILSSFLFVDDYFSSLTVGSVMQPIVDKFKIPRVKLAFLVDSMAASLCSLSPISSYFGAIMSTLRNSQISDHITTSTLVSSDTFVVYLHIIPFIFYSFIVIASAWFIVRHRISFGAMARHERIAKATGNLFGGKDYTAQKIRSVSQKNKDNCSIIDFLLPIVTLLGSVILGLLYSGNWSWFGGPSSAFEAFQNANISIALLAGGLFTLAVTTGYFLFRKMVSTKELPALYWEGINYILLAVIILILSWTLGSFLREDLQTGQYLAHLLTGTLSVSLLPFLFFCVSLVTSFCIGSSWGTMAIMIPIATNMVCSFSGLSIPVSAENIPILFPVLGAIIAGGIVGDHTSPLSDTTIMASASTGSHHLDHVQTQLTYALPIAIATGCSFFMVGFLIHYGLWVSEILSLLVGTAISFGLLALINKLRK